MGKFKGACGAGFNTQGVPLAQVTLIGFFGFSMEQDHLNGAILGAEPAADAAFWINDHNARVGSVDGLGRADIQAIGIFTVVAHHWEMVKILVFMKDHQAGQSGIVSLEQGKGTGQPADAASGTFVKVSMDKGLYGISSWGDGVKFMDGKYHILRTM